MAHPKVAVVGRALSFSVSRGRLGAQYSFGFADCISEFDMCGTDEF